VTCVLRSAAVKTVVPILCTRVEKVLQRVLFIMAKRHPVRNSQLIKAIRDVHSFFQEESFKIRSNQPV
jgi:hypothetical protein